MVACDDFRCGELRWRHVFCGWLPIPTKHKTLTRQKPFHRIAKSLAFTGIRAPEDKSHCTELLDTQRFGYKLNRRILRTSNELRKVCKTAAVACFITSFRNSAGETEEDHEPPMSKYSLRSRPELGTSQKYVGTVPPFSSCIANTTAANEWQPNCSK